MSSFCFERSSCRFWWRRKSHAWKPRIQPDLNKNHGNSLRLLFLRWMVFYFKIDEHLRGWWILGQVSHFCFCFSLVSRLWPSLMRWKGLSVNTTYFTIQRLSTGRVEHPESFLHFFIQRFSEVDTRPIHLGGSLSGRVWNNFWTLSKLDFFFNPTCTIHQWITWEAEVKPWKFSHS